MEKQVDLGCPCPNDTNLVEQPIRLSGWQDTHPDVIGREPRLVESRKRSFKGVT
jgi:hypothetical protein